MEYTTRLSSLSDYSFYDVSDARTRDNCPLLRRGYHNDLEFYRRWMRGMSRKKDLTCPAFSLYSGTQLQLK
jgi:hypothetical protein